MPCTSFRALASWNLSALACMLFFFGSVFIDMCCDSQTTNAQIFLLLTSVILWECWLSQPYKIAINLSDNVAQPLDASWIVLRSSQSIVWRD